MLLNKKYVNAPTLHPFYLSHTLLGPIEKTAPLAVLWMEKKSAGSLSI